MVLLGLHQILCQFWNEILSKYWFLGCIYSLLNNLWFHLLHFHWFLLNKRRALLLHLVADKIIDFLDYFISLNFLLYKTNSYLQPKIVQISIHFEFEYKSILLTLNRLKFSIHRKYDNVQLLNISICIYPSEMCLILLVLKYLKLTYSLDNNFPFCFFRLHFLCLSINYKSSCFKLKFWRAHSI